MQELYVLLLALNTPIYSGGGVGLSDNQISFSTNTVNGWQGLNDGSRAAVAVGENAPLKMESSLGHALYLHPIEQAGTYIYNSKDELITRSGAPLPNDGNLLRVVHHDAGTRGAKYTDASLTNAFGVSAVLTNTTNNTSSSYFQNLKATPSGGSWVTSEAKYWPTDGSLSFYAYYPYSTDSHNMLSENATVDVTNAKTVHYVASANDVEHQPDLIVANHPNVTHGSREAPNSVSLNFSHVLTAITFAVGSDMVPGTVKSIAIKGVKNEGDFDLSANTWKTTSLQGNADFVIPLGSSGQGLAVKGQQDEALTTGAQTLMMIPQTFDNSSNAKVEIVFNKDGVDKTLTAPLRSTQWDAGSTIIYKVSTSSLLPTLTLNKVTFPTDWSSRAEYTGKFKSDYQDNDQLGLYVVAPDGRVKAANVQVTCKGGKWSFPATQPHINVGDKVFAYYPYRSNGDKVLVGMPNATTPANVGDLTSAHSFFKTLEAAWEPEANQSTDAGVNASDLQVSTVSLVNNTGSGIDLKMGHAMGLADITLEKGHHAHFKLSKGDSYTFVGSHLASSTVDGKQLYKLAKNHYIAIVKSGKSTVFNVTTGTCLPWKNSLSFQPNIAEIQKQTAVPMDNDPTIYPYTLGLGDVYYSDGACSHQDDDLEADKTPIDIVGYIAKGGDDYWVEKNTGSGHGGHALVMCVKHIGSKTSGDFGSTFAWKKTVPETNRPFITTMDQIKASSSNENGSGLIQSKAINTPEYPAAYAALHYTDLPAPASKSTGWFLPTIGQYYAICKQLGGGEIDQVWPAFPNDGSKVITKIQQTLTKVGKDNYTDFYQTDYETVWSSSLYSGVYAWYPLSVSGSLDFSGHNTNPSSDYYLPFHESWRPNVRPFLAF